MDILGWVAMLFSWTTLALAGRYRIGWLLNTFVAILWIPYGLWLGSMPVIINTVAFSIIAVRNWIVWDKKEIIN